MLVQHEELYRIVELPDQAIEFLLKKGANPLLQNKDVKTAMELATRSTKKVLENFIAQQKQSVIDLTKGLKAISEAN
jgi:hypothetical protein